jgi:hypothetical protein
MKARVQRHRGHSIKTDNSSAAIKIGCADSQRSGKRPWFGAGPDWVKQGSSQAKRAEH